MSEATPVPRWVSILVPGSDRGGYVRLGVPDAAREGQLLARFDAAAATGLLVAVGGESHELAHGRAETRVLDGSYVVRVMDTAETAGAAPKTRAFLRLGAPVEGERAFTKPAPADICELVVALRPASTKEDTLGAAEGEALKKRVLDGDDDARGELVAKADAGSTRAIRALEALRTAPDVGASRTGPAPAEWALGALESLHARIVRDLQRTAGRGSLADQKTLADRAKAGDTVARGALVPLTTHRDAAVRAWAMGALAAAGGAVASSLVGDGVAIYAAHDIHMTSPAGLRITAGSESRSVLGPSYQEVYDVDDDVLLRLREGERLEVAAIPGKKLVSASLTCRSLLGGWRSTRMERGGYGRFTFGYHARHALGASYRYLGGMNVTNAFAVAFDASAGLQIKVPLGAKFDLGPSGMKSNFKVGSVDHQTTHSLSSSSISLRYSPAQETAWRTVGTLATLGIQAALVAVNTALTAYSVAAAAVGAGSTGEGDSATPDAKRFLEVAEPLQITIYSVNAACAAASLLVGVLQLVTRKVEAVAAAAGLDGPALTVDSQGATLSCGLSFVRVNLTGIELSGPTIKLNSPAIQMAAVPTPLSNVYSLGPSDAPVYSGAGGSAASGQVVGPPSGEPPVLVPLGPPPLGPPPLPPGLPPV